MEQVTMKLSACILLILGIFLHLIEGATDPVSRPRKSLQIPYFGEDDVRVVELLVVVDNTLIQTFQNHRQIEQKVVTAISHVCHLYSKFSIRVVIVGFVFWETGDMISVSTDDTLDSFTKYTEKHLGPTKFDHVMLLSGTVPRDAIIRSFSSTMCSSKSVSVVFFDHKEETLAKYISRSLAYSFGMPKDTENCICQTGEICGMGSNFQHASGWSNCSEEAMSQIKTKKGDRCLKNLPISPFTACGNKIVEPGEECDCGLPEYCTNRCCDAETCLLKKDAKCASGKCCDTKTCEVKSGKVECRQKKGECDVNEYCDDTSEFCPIDRFEPDGTKCSSDQVCMKGVCSPTLELQCLELWGEQFSHVDRTCYNGNSDTKWGFCTYTYNSSGIRIFQACATKDIMCGALFCSTKGEHATPIISYKTRWRDTSCPRVITEGSMEYGIVRDGTKCADEKVCFSNQCINVKDLPQSCYQDCFGNGMCENGQCICKPGYAEQYCSVIATGSGGSSTVLAIFLPIVLFLCVFIICFRSKLLRKNKLQMKVNKMKLRMTLFKMEVMGEDSSQLQTFKRYQSWVKGKMDSGWRNPEVPDNAWEVPRDSIRIIKLIGEGFFGQVWKCKVSRIKDFKKPIMVAVKTVKEIACEKERDALLAEIQVMKELEPHLNVVSLLGCCTEREPILLIMEYINGGTLLGCLRRWRCERENFSEANLSGALFLPKDVLIFSHQIASGMEFLSLKGIVHRDLAARNVLLDTNHKICKIADFGLARDTKTELVYQKKTDNLLPIRWLAPENLTDGVYTTKSDVWSFGILIWEIATLGSTPYPGMSSAEVMTYVRNGYCLAKPDHCKDEIYNIMLNCWEANPTLRPTFAELAKHFDTLICTELEYVDLNSFLNFSYYNVITYSTDEKM